MNFIPLKSASYSTLGPTKCFDEVSWGILMDQGSCALGCKLNKAVKMCLFFSEKIELIIYILFQSFFLY